MNVSDSAKCVAYHYKQKRPNIVNYIKNKGELLDFDYLKRYVLTLTDRAHKTKTQQRIRTEIDSSTSTVELLNIIDRVIMNGNKTKFINY